MSKRTCNRPVGAPGWFDGYCQLPSDHRGDCDERIQLSPLYERETLLLRNIFGSYLDCCNATQDEQDLIKKLGGSA